MDDTPRTDTGTTPTEPIRKRSRTGMMWAILAIVIAFFAGFFWQFYEAYNVRSDLSQVEQELLVERLRIQLGQAALAAQMGEYETARQQMSDFFSRLQDQAAEVPPQVAGTLRNFQAMRDDVITGLSRSNPEYADVLYGMLQEFEAALDSGEAGGAEPADQPESPGAVEGASDG